MLNLDTHILVHALAGSLDPTERNLLSAQPWGISAIVLWELSKLVQLDRIELDFDHQEVKSALNGIHVWPIDLRVARMSTQLDFPGDPADELIAATSIIHGAALVTRDKRIRTSKIVPLAG